MQTKNNKIGVLLLNLGGPDSLDAVRPFLYNLFSDRDIIRLGPSLLQKPIAWLISTFRSKKTIEMYRQIGDKSPILDITTAQTRALEKELNRDDGNRNTETGTRFKVYIAMRYWRPFTKTTVKQVLDDNIDRLIVLTLYPHYSKATTGSSITDFKKVMKELQITNYKLQIHYINEWYNYPSYIDSLAELMAEGMSEYKGEDFHLLFSAHSLPRSFIDEGDPYLDHIKTTIARVLERLGKSPHNYPDLQYQLAFQSKTGPVKWLEPSTEQAIENLSNSECKNLFVVPISFVSDHIETLYEVDIQYKEQAAKYGINLRRCAALNTSDKFIHALKQLVLDKVKEQDPRGQGVKGSSVW